MRHLERTPVATTLGQLRRQKHESPVANMWQTVTHIVNIPWNIIYDRTVSICTATHVFFIEILNDFQH